MTNANQPAICGQFEIIGVTGRGIWAKFEGCGRDKLTTWSVIEAAKTIDDEGFAEIRAAFERLEAAGLAFLAAL